MLAPKTVTTSRRRMTSPSCKTPMYMNPSNRCHLLNLDSNYVITPSQAEIYERNFIVKNLKITFQNTEVLWKGTIDLRSLRAPLSSLIRFGKNYIEVYPNENEKPMAGRELNRNCFATFKNTKSLQREKLKKICKGNGCQLLSVDEENQSFMVEIPHFTRYTFDDELQPEEDTEILNENLVAVLRSRAAKTLQEEQQRLRQQTYSQTIQLVEQNVNNLPSQQLEKEVIHHNISQKHDKMPNKQSLRGHSLIIGQNGIVGSVRRAGNIEYALFDENKVKEMDMIKFVIEICKDSTKFGELIYSNDSSFALKRVLSLYAICFNFNQVDFKFVRRGDDLSIQRSNDIQLGLHNQGEYLKDWFEWVVNFCKQQLNLQQMRIQKQLVQNLCLRKADRCIEKSLRFKKLDEAEFLSKIEDAIYRTGDPPRNLPIELRSISMGDMSPFQQYGWIVKMGVFSWYYGFRESDDSTLNKILAQKGKNDGSNFNIERSILMTFFGKEYDPNLFGQVNEKLLPLWWLISNNNIAQTKLNTDQKYKSFRYELVCQLIQLYPDAYIALQIVSFDKSISKENKSKILKKFIQKNPIEAQRISLDQWSEYSELVSENKGVIHYANKQYFSALKEFGKCRKLAESSLRIIKQIATKQEIICNFHIKTIQKSRQLLENLKTQTLKDEILFLKVVLNQQTLTKTKIQNLLKLCLSFESDKIKGLMLDKLFKSAIKNPNIVILLRKDKQFCEKMEKVFVDPQYRLELKVAKLQL